MTTRTQCGRHVLIDIEDQKRQLYHRLKVNDVTVLVDGTPEGDAAIGMTIDLILAAPDLVAALGKLAGAVSALWDALQKKHKAHSAAAVYADLQESLRDAKAALAKASA